MIYAFCLAALITFVSYQVIPNQIECLDRGEQLAGVVGSDLFTLFIRTCGADHLVMAAGMTGMMMGWFESQFWPMLVVTVSAWCVALISAASAFVIWKAGHAKAG